MVSFARDGDAAPDRRFRFAYAADVPLAGIAPPRPGRLIWSAGARAGALRLDAAAAGGRPIARLFDAAGRLAWSRTLAPGIDAHWNEGPGKARLRGLFWLQACSGRLCSQETRALFLDGSPGGVSWSPDPG
jgi:hypothetical protein